MAESAAASAKTFPQFRHDITTPRSQAPAGAWDTAVHIYADPAQFPSAVDGERLGPAREATIDRLLQLLLSPDVSDHELVGLADAGLRGARFNLASWLVTPPGDADLRRQIAPIGELRC